MTDIDLKRLAVDREYWDSVCGNPSATHYVIDLDPQINFGADFYRCYDGKAVHEGGSYWELNDPEAPLELIPRPAKQEWDGTAFPIPAGAKCEVQMGSFWYPGTVIASTTEAAWFKADQNGEFWTIMNVLSIRPLLTKQQRLRDELAKLVEQHSVWQLWESEEIADAILSLYNLEPKP